MKTTLQSVFTIALLSLGLTVSAQTRYLDDVFSAVIVTSDVTYATNISIFPMLQGLAPGPQDIKCDIYEPTGDSLTNRPVIILVHTGSYLPPVLNGKPTGSKSDLSIVEQCTRWAKKGYVAVAMDYRLGWNPTSTDQNVRTSTLLQAAYRGIQDAKAMVRYLRMTEDNGNPYGIDESKIVLGGQGTGGYISLGYATLDDVNELYLPKFLDFTDPTNPTPYVYPPFFGNPDGTDSAWIPAASSPTGQTELWNIPNNPSYSNDVNMVFNISGALADISWLEAGEVPMVSFHCENDPYVPIDTGDVIVQTTGDFVVEVMGSRVVQHYANQYSNNDPFALAGISDVYTTAANSNNGGLEGLNVFITPPPSTTPNAFGELAEEQGSPWDWWDNATYDAMFQAVNGAPAGYGAANSILGNPNMSATNGNLYLDTIQGFLNPRIYAVLFNNTPTWDCDGLGSCTDPGNGNGTYTSLSACQANCVAVTPFFTNDFSDLAEWTTYDALNGGLQDWVIGTAGPTGFFSMPMGAIASTTTANGFAMFDSDALGSSVTNTQDATITYNGTVDCSAYSYVNINFESSHRKFQDSVFVEISNDAWVTFDRYEVHADQAVNDQSANPELLSVNISSTAGNQASVSFRFHYEGQWDYAWMVDDVNFTEAFNLNDEAELTTLDIVNFSIAPATIDIKGIITNAGGNTINTIDLIWTDGTNSYTDNLTNLNLAPGASYNFTHSDQLTITTPGSVNITVNIDLVNNNIDPNLTNNTLTGLANTVTYIPTKRVVFELGGAAWSGWNPRGAVGLETLEQTYPNTSIGIAVHNGDQMALASYNNAMNIVGYPSGHVDRAILDVDPSQFTSYYSDRINVISPVDISATAVFDVVTRNIDINLSAEFVATLSGDYRFNAVILEDEVGPYDQANYYSGGGAGPLVSPISGFDWTTAPNPVNMLFDNVARAILGGFEGTANSFPSAITAGSIHTYNYTHSLPTTQNENKVRVVGMVIDNATGEIINAISTLLINDNIATARLQGVGAAVTVTGVVTNGDELGLIRYIEDSSGGIALYDSTLVGVVRGDEITVSGILVDYNGLLEMTPVSTSITNNSGNSLTPQLITPIQIGEDTESELIQINNVIFNNGGSLFTSGTHDFTSNAETGKVYIRAGSLLENSFIPMSPVTLVGISSQYTFSTPANDGYQILPRDLADIIQIPNNVSFCFSTVDSIMISETVIGTTTYDLQSNASLQDRIIMHDDGTISAVWTMSQQLNTSFSDRGTGYNFFDGNSWGTLPLNRLESSRGGWPSIIAMGSGKESSITHNTDNAHINMTHRSTTGTGSWTEQNISSLDPSTGIYRDMIWNRSAVGGLNKETIHMIAVTASSNFGGLPFNALDGALVYYRSQDEGVTWDIQDMQLPGMDTSLFDAMIGDAYTITAQGETVVVAYFNDWGDSFIVKSTDNGTTWTKTTFIDFPVDKYTIDDGIDLDNNGILDKVYSTDNYGAVVLDSNGEAHVFYGVMMYADDDLTDASSSWFPSTNGIAYWNESMGEDMSLAISVNDIWTPNSLNIIATAPDLNGDGIVGGVDSTGGYALYYNSRASMPSAGVDSLGNLYVSFSAYTETVDNGSQVFRHINIIKSNDGGETWSCSIDVTPNSAWIGMKECVFGSMNKIVDDKIRIVYQRDNEPGLAVRGDIDLVDFNDIVYLEVSVSIFETNIYGCTDSIAINYDSLATIDNGSCITCNISNTVSISNPSNLTACDGWALSNSVSNYPIVSYNWFNSMGISVGTFNFAMNLCNDIYIVSIMDSAGCQLSDTIIVGVPSVFGCIDSLAYNYDSTANIDDGSCQYCDLSNSFMVIQNTPNNCDGVILANASSSNSPINYLWSNGSTQNNITGLCTGTLYYKYYRCSWLYY